jgi:hypothetical protein
VRTPYNSAGWKLDYCRKDPECARMLNRASAEGRTAQDAAKGVPAAMEIAAGKGMDRGNDEMQAFLFDGLRPATQESAGQTNPYSGRAVLDGGIAGRAVPNETLDEIIKASPFLVAELERPVAANIGTALPEAAKYFEEVGRAVTPGSGEAKAGGKLFDGQAPASSQDGARRRDTDFFGINRRRGL